MLLYMDHGRLRSQYPNEYKNPVVKVLCKLATGFFILIYRNTDDLMFMG
jgi:hypothetical protein